VPQAERAPQSGDVNLPPLLDSLHANLDRLLQSQPSYVLCFLLFFLFSCLGGRCLVEEHTFPANLWQFLTPASSLDKTLAKVKRVSSVLDQYLQYGPSNVDKLLKKDSGK
jgi:hypothetical protein